MVNGPLLLAWSSLWAVTRLENVHGSQSKNEKEKRKKKRKQDARGPAGNVGH